MNVIDSHMHSSFSPDSQAEPVTMIRQALRDHFSHICFTDHITMQKNSLNWMSPHILRHCAG